MGLVARVPDLSQSATREAHSGEPNWQQVIFLRRQVPRRVRGLLGTSAQRRSQSAAAGGAVRRVDRIHGAPLHLKCQEQKALPDRASAIPDVNAFLWEQCAGERARGRDGDSDIELRGLEDDVALGRRGQSRDANGNRALAERDIQGSVHSGAC